MEFPHPCPVMTNSVSWTNVHCVVWLVCVVSCITVNQKLPGRPVLRRAAGRAALGLAPRGAWGTLTEGPLGPEPSGCAGNVSQGGWFHGLLSVARFQQNAMLLESPASPDFNHTLMLPEWVKHSARKYENRFYNVNDGINSLAVSYMDPSQYELRGDEIENTRLNPEPAVVWVANAEMRWREERRAGRRWRCAPGNPAWLPGTSGLDARRGKGEKGRNNQDSVWRSCHSSRAPDMEKDWNRTAEEII